MEVIHTCDLKEKALEAVEKEIKLHINNQLFNKGFISEQMFLTAKKKLLQS